MRQQIEQIVVLQALLAARGGTETVFPKPNAKFNVEIAKPPIVIIRECGQTWTRVRVKYYNY